METEHGSGIHGWCGKTGGKIGTGGNGLLGCTTGLYNEAVTRAGIAGIGYRIGINTGGGSNLWIKPCSVWVATVRELVVANNRQITGK